MQNNVICIYFVAYLITSKRIHAHTRLYIAITIKTIHYTQVYVFAYDKSQSSTEGISEVPLRRADKTRGKAAHDVWFRKFLITTDVMYRHADTGHNIGY